MVNIYCQINQKVIDSAKQWRIESIMRIYTKEMCAQVEKLGESYINKGDYESALFEFRRARGRYATLTKQNINVADDLARCDYFIDYLDDG